MASKGRVNAREKKSKIKKGKLIRSLITGFTVPFALIFASTLITYLENADKFIFNAGDFILPIAIVTLGVFLVLSSLLYFTRGVAHKLIFSTCVGVSLAAMIQRFITTLNFAGLPGDGNVSDLPYGTVLVTNISSAVIWIAVIALCIAAPFVLKKKRRCKTIMSFLIILVLVMQSAMIIPVVMEKKEYTGNGYLTTEGMFELSAEDNVVIFLLDRFDEEYFVDYMSKTPEVSEKLDGFTYYRDNISTYPRTYPGLVSMITGINTDFSDIKNDYLDRAYEESTFLRDLKDNGYKVNLYIQSYYAYNTVPEIADNKYVSVEYEVTNSWGLAGKMFEMGSYYWAPELFKSQTISQKSFDAFVERGTAPEKYITDDPAFYEAFTSSGLTTQNEKKTYTFYDLNGCHAPYVMDANCNAVEENSVAMPLYSQTAGCFKIIYEYIDEMKRLGIYENSTIIITGDHGWLKDGDKVPYTSQKITGLIVKEKGQSGTTMKTSDAPVSQANFIPSIVKSEGIDTTVDYGMAYNEVTSENNPVRTHYFQSWLTDPEMNYIYEITGDGHDFDNWKIVGEPYEIKGGVYGNK